ncbi:hypothetical protein [Actinoplanes flavus]|uniref:Lipoprotein n=1 Tax=Actinoplanes flavus TaxID=2820290 RepID=A0ABS3UPX3_9ACTN|nr:hypothetical protein [Actinoplanes flavus]MBO3740812.1 hypothetical protein [Actinoplanes flavus]
MRARPPYRIALALTAVAIVAGCASSPSSGTLPASSAPSTAPSPDTPSPEPSAEASSAEAPSAATPLPTITLTKKPPKEPTDPQPSTGWVTGMVTRGGKGPCYGMITDDGQRYALYSTEGVELAKGDRIKAHLETTMLRIYCGPGTLMAMTEVEQIK